jgi:Ca-activated chloride channel family protein
VTFSHPLLLHALWLVPLLILLFIRAFRSAARARVDLWGAALVSKLAPGWNPRRDKTKAMIQLTALALLTIAVAGPRAGSREVTMKRRGIDIMIAIDVSNSMLARDIPPSRLAKAKREVSAFLERLEGDRVGVVAFAGDAYLQCPLTLDYGAARMFLDVIDPGSVTRQGTNLGAAIRTAMASHPEEEDKYKAIVLVTDGEDLSGDGLAAAEEAGKRGIRIDTIGVGSESGEPIPLVDESGTPGGYKKDSSGEVVMTRLDAESLERIALAAGGQFHRATTGELELDRLYESLAKIQERELASKTITQYEERFQIPLGLAIALLLLDLVLPDRVRARREWEGRFA